VIRPKRRPVIDSIVSRAVLPKSLRDRLVSELDKRLDLDLDEVLRSPKLRLKLAPAELDKSLLELYDMLSESPSGDVLRLIGGGGPVGLQNLYMKQQSQKKKRRQHFKPDIFASFADIETKESDRTASQWVRWALTRNLPKDKDGSVDLPQKSQISTDKRETPHMCASFYSAAHKPSSWIGLRPPSSTKCFNQCRRSLPASLLI
jgi:hypothetical protein